MHSEKIDLYLGHWQNFYGEGTMRLQNNFCIMCFGNKKDILMFKISAQRHLVLQIYQRGTPPLSPFLLKCRKIKKLACHPPSFYQCFSFMQIPRKLRVVWPWWKLEITCTVIIRLLASSNCKQHNSTCEHCLL